MNLKTTANTTTTKPTCMSKTGNPWLLRVAAHEKQTLWEKECKNGDYKQFLRMLIKNANKSKEIDKKIIFKDL